ncbi:hypothetical protein FC756_23125 [Lysinibacillus mangiferihumi]|uniref:YopX protein domain-containing protein n=1 Tax=Lysinibacillus mangiferihumi TaxID=1130819 RepID=A0A4U2Y1V4_9BACI|nr:YopX family protein [Lysinibacillus mangiferihumi]TKI53522.1 hypothetical protein FC756_23125 [Lysinibacillus mangiferihumi]
MREIKFRAWWSNIGEMEYFDTVAFLNFEDGTLIYQKHPEEETCTDEISDGFELMQYTGLKDKNGKEIYEGDILKTPSASGIGDIITTIEWTEFSWKEKLIYSPIHQFYEYFDFSDETGNDCEVIGNIYENPELLEGIA